MPLKRVIESLKTFLRNFSKKQKNNLKPFHIGGDFSLNILDHDKSSKVHNFLNLLYVNGMIPTINKSTRVARKTSTAINHLSIFKNDISQHYSVCIILSSKMKLDRSK